jgi:hypothetical protein
MLTLSEHRFLGNDSLSYNLLGELLSRVAPHHVDKQGKLLQGVSTESTTWDKCRMKPRFDLPLTSGHT